MSDVGPSICSIFRFSVNRYRNEPRGKGFVDGFDGSVFCYEQVIAIPVQFFTETLACDVDGMSPMDCRPDRSVCDWSYRLRNG